ncbi:ParB/RepB/Spo0J family partition protein [Clostridium sp. AN503]|uniref:ParB/RepB/Spo0J family partition protein n=1 Tax=Clostridium sp. AN503 TaxID=3160598 RepID=UPI0034574923
MADDKKDLKPEEQAKNGPTAPEQHTPGKDTPPAKEAAGLPPAKEAPVPEKDSGPKQEKAEAAGPADKSRPGNVIDISGAMIDKIVAEKEKAAKVAEAGKEQPAEPAKTEQKEKKESEKQAGRTPKAVKKAPEKSDKPPAAKKAEPKKEAPAPEKPKEPEKPAGPVAAPRSGEPEQIVHINLSELHAFKNHPFQVRDDEEMRAMVASVKDKGVTQPAIVRPREGGGYEIVSGHRRQKASQLAGYLDMPCIVRNLTDEQAITQMVEDNTNQRENILPSERAKALKMQLEAIKHQGARETSGQIDPKEAGKRSNEIVALRNKMTVKQVQRYIKLNDLVPELSKAMDEGRIKFTPAVELAYIAPKNQQYIAVAIDAQQSAPSLSQAQRMRELDQKGVLNGDVIDGIMLEEKKEVDKVIINGAELEKYFGKEKTPQEMKEQIIKLLDDWKGKQKEHAKPEKKAEKEK